MCMYCSWGIEAGFAGAAVARAWWVQKFSREGDDVPEPETAAELETDPVPEQERVEDEILVDA